MKTDIRILGETFTLFAEKALCWNGVLVVADAHFGKSAAFREAGIPVPAGTTAADLNRLDRLIAASAAASVIFLGDFAHTGGRLEAKTFGAVAAWRRRHAPLPMTLVLGNHDRNIGEVARGLSIETAPEIRRPPFVFRHDPPPASEPAYAVVGHIHPAVRLFDEAGGRLRAPCFWFNERYAVVPAFGGFTGLYDIQPGPRDGVVAVGEGELAVVRAPAFA